MSVAANTARAEGICLTLAADGRGIAIGLDGRSSQKLYTGNDFIVMSQSTNSTIKGMSVSISLRLHSPPIHSVGRYTDLCKFVNGRYP